jgi:hypothetical protein
MNEGIAMQFNKGPDGDQLMTFNLTPEHYETLKALKDQPSWKLYRALLIKAKEGYFHSVLPMNESIPMAKTIGMVAGLNFAINQLPVLIGLYEQQKAKKLAEAEANKPPES